MYHMTVVGDIRGPADVQRDVAELVEKALNEIVKHRAPGKLPEPESVSLTPLTTLGGWPMTIAVTVMARID